MKQKVATYLSTLDSTIYKILSELYSFNEPGYHEYKAYSFITDIFKNNNFRIDEHLEGINTAFKAEFGTGYPVIALICEYDSCCTSGHIFGTNILNAVSISSALALTKVIPELGGKIQIYGCPGESIDGSKAILAKLGAFNDVDAVLSFQPHNLSAPSRTSPATLPICIRFEFQDKFNMYKNPSSYWHKILGEIIKLFDTADNICIDNITVEGSLNRRVLNGETKIDFTIKSSDIDSAYEYKENINNLLNELSKNLNYNFTLELKGSPYKDLKTNETLDRIFLHNMKENGIIDIEKPQDYNYGISLGNVSEFIPTIKPFIKIGDANRYPFATEEFSKLSLKKDTITIVKNISSCLCCTFIDLVEKESLLDEAKMELNKS